MEMTPELKNFIEWIPESGWRWHSSFHIWAKFDGKLNKKTTNELFLFWKDNIENPGL